MYCWEIFEGKSQLCCGGDHCCFGTWSSSCVHVHNGTVHTDCGGSVGCFSPWYHLPQIISSTDHLSCAVEVIIVALVPDLQIVCMCTTGRCTLTVAEVLVAFHRGTTCHRSSLRQTSPATGGYAHVHGRRASAPDAACFGLNALPSWSACGNSVFRSMKATVRMKRRAQKIWK